MKHNLEKIFIDGKRVGLAQLSLTEWITVDYINGELVIVKQNPRSFIPPSTSVKSDDIREFTGGKIDECRRGQYFNANYGDYAVRNKNGKFKWLSREDLLNEYEVVDE